MIVFLKYRHTSNKEIARWKKFEMEEDNNE